MQAQVRSAPAPSHSQVALQRRPHTEEPDEYVEITSDVLLGMNDEQLYTVLTQLGLTLPRAWSRDKLIELIMKVATTAKDL